MKKHISLLVLMLLIFISVIIIKPNRENTINLNIQSKYSKIRVVMDDNYPPYIFRDSNGKLQGILVDQWGLWDKKTGIKVEIEAMEWNKALSKMKDGEYDAIDTIFLNDERDEFVDELDEYQKDENPEFDTEEGLKKILQDTGFTNIEIVSEEKEFLIMESLVQ